MTKIIVKKGTRMVCKKCGDHIATIAYDLISGMNISASMFKGGNQKLLAGERMECKKCGNGWEISCELGVWTGLDWSVNIIDSVTWGKDKEDKIVF